MKPAERIKKLENRLDELNTILAAYKHEENSIKEGGRKMRICRIEIKLNEPETLPDDEPKKTQKPLTAAQKRKVEALRKRLTENNRARIQGVAVNVIPIDAEIRGNKSIRMLLE